MLPKASNFNFLTYIFFVLFFKILINTTLSFLKYVIFKSAEMRNFLTFVSRTKSSNYYISCKKSQS
ncbi:hypothetical protein DF947_03645 [Pedobacter paludis]|uniref:Uncharacterized protein n=1 Tax=Pedobacter paludis TaxID=2203212 RepID=A0A317F817_9SPHI|nr:hypothetical protein DF947_03645 [Pedobacter paludis]